MSPESRPEERTLSSPGAPQVTTPLHERRGDLFDPLCPTRDLLDRLGSKWVAMIITLLARRDPEEMRFAQLERAMPGVSHRMLSQELKRLVRDGLVRRRVEDSTPPKVFYGLTPLGVSLHEPLSALRDWAESHIGVIDAARSE